MPTAQAGCPAALPVTALLLAAGCASRAGMLAIAGWTAGSPDSAQPAEAGRQAGTRFAIAADRTGLAA